MNGDLPTRFSHASVSAARNELSKLGISTNVTVLACGQGQFDEVAAGSAYIDCESPTHFHRDYPCAMDASVGASWLKRILLARWFRYALPPPGVKKAENGVPLTNARRARIRLCRDGEQRWEATRHPFFFGDGSVPTFYVEEESGLFRAVRVVGRELTLAPMRRHARALAEVCGEALGFLGFAIVNLLLLLGCCATVLVVVFGLGRLVGLW